MSAFLSRIGHRPTQLAIGTMVLFLVGGAVLQPPAELHPWALGLVFLLFLGCVVAIPIPRLVHFYRFAIWTLIFGVLLNLAWELWHSIYFTHFTEPGYTYVALVEMLFGSTVGDGVIILGLLFALTLARGGRWAWHSLSFWPHLALLIAAATAIQISIEVDALRSGLWAYNARMPLIPFLNVGWTPVLQMPVLTPLSFWMAQRMTACPVAVDQDPANG